jgi:signal transduction histidine kinase/HAMP domain-containing protein
MMAINFARAASVDFLQMENAALRARTAPVAEHKRLSRHIDELAGTLSDDLDVAKDRSTAADERKAIENIRSLVRRWQDTRHAALAKGSLPELRALNQKVLSGFDMLIELNADHGFVSRRTAIDEIDNFGYVVLWATAAALLFAIGITLFLTRRISRPLSDAARVADRIAAGEFDTAIPTGGRGETGALLNSMTVMQRNIAGLIGREQARAQSAESRLMDAIESSGEGVILSDADERIAIASSEVARFFPSLAEEIKPGRKISSALLQIEEHSEPEFESDLPLTGLLLSERAGIATTERKLPDNRWLRFTANRTSDGGVIVFLSDFTDVKARERRYRDAKLAAEEAGAAKIRFLANMSHELRTPLNAIIGFSEVMTTQIFGPLGNARYLEYLHDILRSGRHLLDIINSVLDLAKSDAGRLSLDAEPVDIRSVLGDCAKMLAGQCAAADIALTFEAPGEQAVVIGETAKLRQIFLNLMSNAMKFTEAGGAVVISACRRDGEIVIAVKDTGIGMSPEEIEVALTPFAQVDNRLERRYEGTGLGLPLAKSLIELHSGRLHIESEPGKGTVVRVHLPAMEEYTTELQAAS